MIALDEMTRRLRNANPFTRTELPEAALTTLDDIMAGRRRPSDGRNLAPARRRRWVPPVIVSSSLVLVAVLVAVIALVVLRPQAALAATPVPLPLAPTTATVDSLREDLVDSAPTAPTGSTRGAEWDGWYLQLDADNPEAAFIQPQHNTISWAPDMSGSSTVIAGAPMQPDGQTIEPLPSGATEPGTGLSQETWAPGELTVPFVATPPDDVAAMRTYLETYLDTGGTPSTVWTDGDYLQALAMLAQTWTLSGGATQAAIGVILSAPGVNVAGTTTDRSGRIGLVLNIDPTAMDPTHRAQLVIDPSTWRLLALEHISVDGIPEFRIPAGAVTDYTLWG